MRTYRAVYRASNGNEIVIKSLRRPPPKRTFRTAAGRRKHSLVKLQTSMREVIIVARTKNRRKAVEQDELEEIEALEELEDLEDLEDEEEVEDEEDVEEEDEDEEEEDEEEDDEEEPEDEEEEDDEEEEEEAPRARRKKAAPKKTVKQSREAADGRVGTQEVADHFNIDSRQLRILLRRNNVPTDPDSGRYSWKSLKDPRVVKIGKLIKSGAAKAAQKEQLEKVRSRKTTAKPAAKKTSTTKKTGTATKTRRRRAVEEDED
jgi:hypothetical protein